MGAHKETLKLYNKYEERICTKEEEDVSIVKRRKRRDTQVHF